MKSRPMVFLCIFLGSSSFGYCRQSAPDDLVRAVWDWAMPKETAGEQREFVAFAQQCGFNTVITSPTRTIVEEAHARSMLICDILTPTTSRDFARRNPDCIQKLLPFEEGIARLMDDPPFDNYNVYRMHSHQEYNTVEGGNYL